MIMIIKRILNWAISESTGGSQYDGVVNMPPQYKVEGEVIPFARGAEVPPLGSDHAALVQRAEVLYTDDCNRLKWLMAIYHLRHQTKRGWILKPNNSVSVSHLSMVAA